MKNTEKMKKWLWLGMEEQTAKRYQRRIAADNIEVIKHESIVIALICSLYTIYFLSTPDLKLKGIGCLVGVSAMFIIFFYANLLVKRKEGISKKEAWICMGMFMICAYGATIWVGTFGGKDQVAVTSVCLFVLMQTSFDILPLYNISITFVAAIVFFASSFSVKSMDIFMYDVMDATIAIVIGHFVAYEKAKIKWQSVKLQEQVEKERDIDLLTGIWNRRAFEREVNRIIECEKLKNMAVIMLDIDKFKEINDGYGHEMGDVYLEHFSELFKSFIRENTVVGRRSGDEFFMFIYNYEKVSNIDDCMKEFYQKLEQNPIELPDGTKRVIRVSAGIVWTMDKKKSWTDLLCAADEEMYFIKEHGRNSYIIKEYQV